MKRIRNTEDLKSRIRQLEEKKEIQEQLIEAEFLNLRMEWRPINLLKNTWQDFKKSPDYRADMLENAASLGMSIIAGKLKGGSSSSWFSTILRAGVQLGIDKAAGPQNEKIRSWGRALYNGIFGKQIPSR